MRRETNQQIEKLIQNAEITLYAAVITNVTGVLYQYYKTCQNNEHRGSMDLITSGALLINRCWVYFAGIVNMTMTTRKNGA